MVAPASPAKASLVKPYCRSIKRGSLGSDIDGRSTAGKFLRRIEAELVEHVGGHPTFAEHLLIRRVARLSLQAESLDAKMASGEWTGHDAKTLGGINSAIRNALRDLGLKRKEKASSPSLAEIASRHAKADTAP